MSESSLQSICVIVCWPSSGQVKNDFAYSLAKLTAHFASHRMSAETETQMLGFETVEGSLIANNREYLIERALAHDGMTHLLFVDDDMGFAPDTLSMLLNRRLPIVGCNYRMRMVPGEFTAFRADVGRIATDESSVGLMPVDYLGFGFCLIERRVLESVKAPRFEIKFDYGRKAYTSEDLPFFAKCKSHGFFPRIDHDASKRVWHCGSLSYHWNERYEGVNESVARRAY